MFAPLVNYEAKKREYRCVLAVFSYEEQRKKECVIYVMKKYRMTIDEEESSSIRRVSCAQSNKRQKGEGD